MPSSYDDNHRQLQDRFDSTLVVHTPVSLAAPRETSGR